MKRFKRSAAMLLAATLLAVGLTGCGKKQEPAATAVETKGDAAATGTNAATAPKEHPASDKPKDHPAH